MDWSKYTDEGWYGDAAIRQLQRGQWYVRGDFNPAVALPVWPLLEFAVFSATGVSLIAARALSVSVFVGIVIAAYVLVRRISVTESPASHRSSLAPAVAATLLAVSPFCFVFSRLAILEPLLILLTLLALIAASSARRGRVLPIVCLGILIPLMVLTKTTAVFLLPSVLWMLWASCGYRVRSFLSAGIPVAGIAAGLWSAYFVFVVRPRFLEDYRYLFSANAYTAMTRENAVSVLEATVRDGMWMGGILYPVALAAILAAFVFSRRCFRNPLVPSLMLWAAGYTAFLAYHNNLQPRYYLVVAVPLTLLTPVVVEEILGGIRDSGGSERRFVVPVMLAAAAGFLSIVLTDTDATLRYVLKPQYTFTQAASELRSVVMADHGHSPLLLSISGSDLSLMTGLPSICDDFGTMTLENRVATYRPGWYATWNEVDDDKMDALSPMYHLKRVAAFPAFDDPERNLMILYRLDPPSAEAPARKHHKAVPRSLQTRIGQQPSATQLEH